MSKSQAIAFFEEISKNQQLAQEVEKVVKGKNSDETKAKELLSLAKDHGFNFTKYEAASAQGALKTSLSPEEMLEVSGGKLNLKSSLMAAAMLLGLGVGGAAMSSMEASAMKSNKPSPIDQATLSAFRSAHPLSFTVYNGYEPRQPERRNAGGDDRPNITDEGVQWMEEEGHRIADENNGEALSDNYSPDASEIDDFKSSEEVMPVEGMSPTEVNRILDGMAERSERTIAWRNAVYPGQQTRRQPTQTNQQGLGLIFNPSLVGQLGAATRVDHTQREKLFAIAQMNSLYPGQQTRQQTTQPNQQGLRLIFNQALVGQPGSEHTQKEKRKEKLSRKQEMKQQREQEENSRPKLPVNRAEQRNGDEQVRKRHAHRDAGWAIKSALTAANRDALVAKYCSGASETSDRKWIISVARAAANGLRPNLDLQLTPAPHKDFRERCAYCGRAGCVEISEPDKYGQLFVRCTHEGCPLNWVNCEHRRQVSPSTPSVAAYKYEVKRWAMLPALIEEIKNLVDRTEYDNYGKAVRLHDSAEVAQQANNARQQANNARRQAATRVQTIEKLQSGEKLSDDEKRDLAKKAAKAGLVKCRTTRAPGGKGCGSTNVRLNAPPKGNNIQFRCKDCKKTFSYKIDELLAMVQDVPEEMANTEQNEPQMQMLRANHTFNMNQMNNNNNINNLNNTSNLNNNNFNHDVFSNEEVDNFGMDFDDDN